MSLLLNPRVWIALVLVALLTFTHVFVYRAGKATERSKTDAERIATAKESIRKTDILQDKRDAALNAGVARNTALLADSRRTRELADGLSGELAAQREWASHSLAAASASAAALGSVFESCTRRYIDVATAAQGHQGDAMTCNAAWPKEKQ